jgi:hypothetical protein
VKPQDRGPFLAVIAAAALLGARFFWMTWTTSVNLVFWDQWDFLTPFFSQNSGWLELFRWQHGPHRQGLGLFVDKVLFPLTAWNVRFDSLEVAIYIFAAMVAALWLKRRLYGSWSYFDVVIPLLFLTLRHAETLVVSPNPAVSAIPLLLIVLFCCALLDPLWPRRFALLLLLNFLLIYTGYGVLMGVVTLGVFALEAAWKRAPLPWALGAFGVAALSLASFFVHYTWNPAVECFEAAVSPVSYFRFTALMQGAVLLPPPSSSRLITAVGGIVLLAALTIVVVHVFGSRTSDTRHESRLVGTALIAYSLVFVAATAYGRTCLELPGAALPSRYTTSLVPGMLGLYLFLISSPARFARVALALLLLLLIPASALDRLGIFSQVHDKKQSWVDCYRQFGSINHCSESTVGPYPDLGDPEFLRKFAYLQEHRLSFFAETGR